MKPQTNLETLCSELRELSAHNNEHPNAIAYMSKPFVGKLLAIVERQQLIIKNTIHGISFELLEHDVNILNCSLDADEVSMNAWMEGLKNTLADIEKLAGEG